MIINSKIYYIVLIVLTVVFVSILTWVCRDQERLNIQNEVYKIEMKRSKDSIERLNNYINELEKTININSIKLDSLKRVKSTIRYEYIKDSIAISRFTNNEHVKFFTEYCEQN